ncbi:MFS transporter [Clostridium sp. 'White wine YQ']|uniref:MFS transporter n=1 Tax=Clostridium sp. 'White wine YQ' TaxID=3027474 RepID=UPI002366A917|nr:MFS transporter [Clostridium sp. 'White wine YQ']MDD7796358.1 MFS transporter [Clostridium sp. 'White wine YQ']
MNKYERSWILQDFGNSAYSIVITTAILPVFFKQVAANNMADNISTAYWGYANALATLIISILAPFLGTIADYKGYKKKFFTCFLLIGVISTALLATVSKGNWLMCLAIYIFTTIGFSGSNIFYDSFLTDVTEDSKMDKVSSYGYAWGYIGGTIPFLICILIITNASSLGITTIFATQISFLITSIWWLLFSFPILRNVNQKYYIDDDPKTIIKELKKLLVALKKLKHNRNVFLFLLAFFFYIDGVHTVFTMATAYGIDIGIDSNTIMKILVVIQIVAFPFAILYGILAKKFSTKAMILIGIITYTIVSIYAFFIKTQFDFWILSILVASAQGGIQALSRSFYGKIIPKENSAEYFGIYNIFGRISAVIGPLLIGIIGTITGSSKYGILSLVVLFFIGGFLFLKVKNNNSEISV